MNQGTIVQCIGAVTDIQFPREAMPKIYDALALEESNDASFAEKGLIFEVEQQLGLTSARAPMNVRKIYGAPVLNHDTPLVALACGYSCAVML